MKNLVALRPNHLIARCALRFASNWYIEPGRTESLRWTQDYAWRPLGIRFGANARDLELVQIRTGCHDNLVQPCPALAFGPLMTSEELNELGGAAGTVIDVPYTPYGPRLPVRSPARDLAIMTLARGDTLKLSVKNIGATPQLVDGAIFYAKVYVKGA